VEIQVFVGGDENQRTQRETLEERQEPTTNSTTCGTRPESNLGNIVWGLSKY